MCKSRAISGCRKMLPVSKKHRSMRHMSRIMFRMLWKKFNTQDNSACTIGQGQGKERLVSRCPADKCVTQRLSIHDQLPWSKPAPRQCSHSSGTKRPECVKEVWHTSTTKNVWKLRDRLRERGKKLNIKKGFQVKNMKEKEIKEWLSSNQR